MPRVEIEEITASFDDVFRFIRNHPDSILQGLETRGGIHFSCQAKVSRDRRRYISLPHSNRIYEEDWGYYFNSMGKAGQRIGHYSVQINEKYLECFLNVATGACSEEN